MTKAIYTVVIKCTAGTLEYDGEEEEEGGGGGGRWRGRIKNLNRLGIAPIAIFCLVTETKGQTFRGIHGFYSTSGAVDYTAVIFSAPLVAVKCEVFYYY